MTGLYSIFKKKNDTAYQFSKSENFPLKPSYMWMKSSKLNWGALGRYIWNYMGLEIWRVIHQFAVALSKMASVRNFVRLQSEVCLICEISSVNNLCVQNTPVPCVWNKWISYWYAINYTYSAHSCNLVYIHEFGKKYATLPGARCCWTSFSKNTTRSHADSKYIVESWLTTLTATTTQRKVVFKALLEAFRKAAFPSPYRARQTSQV